MITGRGDRFTPGKDPVPIAKKDGWAEGSVWALAENLASTDIRSPDRPGRSVSLYRLSYPGLHLDLLNSAKHKELLFYCVLS